MKVLSQPEREVLYFLAHLWKKPRDKAVGHSKIRHSELTATPHLIQEVTGYDATCIRTTLASLKRRRLITKLDSQWMTTMRGDEIAWAYPAKMTAVTRKALLSELGSVCANPCCAQNNDMHRAFTAHELDHIWPVSLGGTSDPVNLQVMCVECNRRKRNLPMQVFVAQERERAKRQKLITGLERLSNRDLIAYEKAILTNLRREQARRAKSA